MSISFPYSAVAWEIINRNGTWTFHVIHQKLHFSSISSRAFPRASYRELPLEVMDLMGPEELMELYPGYFKDAELPDFVLVDTPTIPLISMTCPTQKPDQSIPTHSAFVEGSEGSFGEAAKETQGIGVEPPVLFTPGLYAIISTASASRKIYHNIQSIGHCILLRSNFLVFNRMGRIWIRMSAGFYFPYTDASLTYCLWRYFCLRFTYLFFSH